VVARSKWQVEFQVQDLPKEDQGEASRNVLEDQGVYGRHPRGSVVRTHTMLWIKVCSMGLWSK
jgi:hypothetical protein